MPWFRRKPRPVPQDPFLNVSGAALDQQLRTAIHKFATTPPENGVERETALAELRVIQAEQRRRLLRPTQERFRRMQRMLG